MLISGRGQESLSNGIVCVPNSQSGLALGSLVVSVSVWGECVVRNSYPVSSVCVANSTEFEVSSSVLDTWPHPFPVSPPSDVVIDGMGTTALMIKGATMIYGLESDKQLDDFFLQGNE